ncbi:MAG TPA: PaeR7I family type II restriction endonuclease [Terracidiphilus sp.]|nr:PaeR7I family type II restriction endonuclease [Terracidiphilus sp.]
MSLQPYWQDRLSEAIRFFWKTRQSQSDRQGARSGSRDSGSRTAVTGGKQLDGFVELLREYLEQAGLDRTCIYTSRKVELPGWYRAEKKWDLLIVREGHLIAAMEFKSQVGSFGNNFNNRTEEALGNATDIWAAFREGAFAPSLRPWLGYVMVLEEAKGSLTSVGVQEPHFKVFPEFRESSYAKRYEILLTKLIRERLYDSATLILTNRLTGRDGRYVEPSPELGFENLLISLKARAVAIKEVTE